MSPILRFALGMTALSSLACLGCSQGSAQTAEEMRSRKVAASTAESVLEPVTEAGNAVPQLADEMLPETFPLIEIEGHRMERLQVDPPLPPFHDAVTFVNEQPKSVEAGNLRFTCKRGGVIVLQVSFEDDGAGDWKAYARTRKTMPQNWTEIGPAPWDESQILFMRAFRASNPCAIRTRKFIAPQPILIDAQALDDLRKEAGRDLTDAEAVLFGLHGPSALAPRPVVAERPVSPPAGAAVLDVEGMNLYALEGGDLPPYLQGAAMYRREDSQPGAYASADGLLRFRVAKGGPVFLLATWKAKTGYNDRSDALSYRELSVHWAPLGRCAWYPNYWLFVRDCKAGEQFELRTATYSPPLPIVVPPVDLLSEEYAELIPVRYREEPILRQMIRLVEQKDYDEIERLAELCRNPEERFASHRSPLWLLYAALRNVEKRDKQHYAERIEELEKWVANSPNSLTARVALANVLKDYAYFVRGSGFADTVSERRFKVFHEQLSRAEKVLLRLDESVPRDVGYYAARIIIGNGLDAGREEAVEWALAAAELDPWNQSATSNAAMFFLQRWNGQPGDLVKLAEALAEATRDECGEGQYARVVMGVHGLTGRRTFAEDNFSWERTRQGLADLRERFPESQFILSEQCRLACMAFDRDLAQACFAEIGDDPDLMMWNTIETYEQHRLAMSQGVFDGDQDRMWLPHAHGTKHACFSPDGTKLLTSGADSLIKLWDAASGQVLRQLALMGSDNHIDFLDGSRIAIGTDYGEIYIWDWESDVAQPVTRLPKRIVALDASPDGRFLFVADARGHAVAVDLNRSEEVYRFEGSPHFPNQGVFSSDSRWLAATGSRNGVVLHSLTVNREDSRIGSSVSAITALAFSSDGAYIAAGGRFGDVNLWQADRWRTDRWRQDEEVRRRLSYNDTTSVRGLAFMPDGKHLVIARGRGKSLEKGGLWIAALDGKSRQRRIAGHTTGVYAVALSPDGNTFLSVGADWTLRLYDTTKLQLQ